MRLVTLKSALMLGASAAFFAVGYGTGRAGSAPGLRVPPHAMKCHGLVRLFASDRSGALDEFCEDHPTVPIVRCLGGGGWGLAVGPAQTPASSLLAVGTNAGQVEIYSIPSNGLISCTPINSAPLTLSLSGGDANGLCFNSAGGLYAADNVGNLENAIDYFAPSTYSAGGAPTGTFQVTNFLDEVTSVACDVKRLNNGTYQDVLVAEGNPRGGTYAIGYLLIPTPPAGPTNPIALNLFYQDVTGNIMAGHGIALNKRHDLVVNTGYFNLWDFGVYPWTGAIVANCTYSINYNVAMYGIAFDNGPQDEIWGGTNVVGNIEASSYAYPLANNANCVTPGLSGGPSQPLSGEQTYRGVAVWPNAGT